MKFKSTLFNLLLPFTVNGNNIQYNKHSLQNLNINKLEAFKFLYHNSNQFKTRKRRDNNEYFEELKAGDLERECLEELCSKEEISEIYAGDIEKTDNFYKDQTQSCTRGSSHRKDDNGKTINYQACNTKHTAKCVQKFGSHECICLPGWTGKACNQDIDECHVIEVEKGKKACPDGYDCINHERTLNPEDYGFICKVRDGYQTVQDPSLASNQVPITFPITVINSKRQAEEKMETLTYTKTEDIDECKENLRKISEDPTEPPICPFDKQCKNKIGHYSCDCKDGYTEIGETGNCEDVDECEMTDGRNACSEVPNTDCQNVSGSYNCVCKPGFEPETSGQGDIIQGACKDIEECSLYGIGKVEAGGEDDNCVMCEELPGSFQVSCAYGNLIRDDNLFEYSCQNVNECQLENECPQYAECVDRSPCELKKLHRGGKILHEEIEGYTCKCPLHFKSIFDQTQKLVQCDKCSHQYSIKITANNKQFAAENNVSADYSLPAMCTANSELNIQHCNENGRGITFTKASTSNSCLCGESSQDNPGLCDEDLSVISESYTCQCNYQECYFKEMEPEECQPKANACDQMHVKNNWIVPGFREIKEICHCPDGNNGMCINDFGNNSNNDSRSKSSHGMLDNNNNNNNSSDNNQTDEYEDDYNYADDDEEYNDTIIPETDDIYDEDDESGENRSDNYSSYYNDYGMKRKRRSSELNPSIVLLPNATIPREFWRGPVMEDRDIVVSKLPTITVTSNTVDRGYQRVIRTEPCDYTKCPRVSTAECENEELRYDEIDGKDCKEQCANGGSFIQKYVCKEECRMWCDPLEKQREIPCSEACGEICIGKGAWLDWTECSVDGKHNRRREECVCNGIVQTTTKHHPECFMEENCELDFIEEDPCETGDYYSQDYLDDQAIELDSNMQGLNYNYEYGETELTDLPDEPI